MKRIIAFILAFVYITSTSGAVVTTHYCAGKIKSVSIQLSAKSCDCKAMQAKGCCKTDQKLVKLNDTHKASVTAYNFATPDHVPFSGHHVKNYAAFDKGEAVLHYSNSSPPLHPVPLYIAYSVFLI